MLSLIRKLRRSPLGVRVTKFAISSVVAAATSGVVFALLYVMGVSTTVDSILAFVAGAIPNWTINRRWTWKVEGSVAWGREIVAYIVVSASTLVLLSLATGWTDHRVKSLPEGHGIRVILVTGSYFGVLAVLYGIRFFLYEFWIFSGQSRIRAGIRARRDVWATRRAAAATAAARAAAPETERAA